jgi:hypothetical protein
MASDFSVTWTCLPFYDSTFAGNLPFPAFPATSGTDVMFLKIFFAKKIGEKNGVFDSEQS